MNFLGLLSFSITVFCIFGPFCLQMYLSKKENKYLGLILPIPYTLFNIYLIYLELIWKDSYFVTYIIFFTFIVLILWIIYFICRRHVKKQMEFKKIKDL